MNKVVGKYLNNNYYFNDNNIININDDSPKLHPLGDLKKDLKLIFSISEENAIQYIETWLKEKKDVLSFNINWFLGIRWGDIERQLNRQHIYLSPISIQRIYNTLMSEIEVNVLDRAFFPFHLLKNKRTLSNEDIELVVDFYKPYYKQNFKFLFNNSRDCGQFSTNFRFKFKNHILETEQDETKDKFLTDSIVIHKNKYDYSLVNFIDSFVPVKIICPVHGVFEQIPYQHLYNNGDCFRCPWTPPFSTDRFKIETVNEIVNQKSFYHYYYENTFYNYPFFSL